MTDLPFDLLLGADEAYFQHLAVTLMSLAVNNRHHPLRITVALQRPLPGPQSCLRAMLEPFANITLRFVAVDETIFAALPVCQHFTPAMYIRLLAAQLLPPSADRCLYLDSDLVVCHDIGDLWHADLAGRPVGAVPDLVAESGHSTLSTSYFNSGVLLLDMEHWRRDRAGEACLDYIESHADILTYPDQDALNAVFGGRIQPLPLRWNWQARMAEYPSAGLGMTRGEFRAVRRTPAIVHYTTGSKPWMYRKEVHYAALYRRYLSLTPWRDTVPPDRTLLRRLSKTVRLMRLRRWLRWMRAG